MSGVSARRLPRFSALIAGINHTAEPAIGQDEPVIAVAVLTGGGADRAAGSDPAVALPLYFGEIGEIQRPKSEDSLVRLGTLLKPLP